MAKKNPFREARSVQEFFKLLRAELTRLRGGARFRHWKWGGVFVRGHELVFWLDCDRTHVVEVGGWERDISWVDLAESDLHVTKPGTLRRWNGFGLFSSSGGGSGEKRFSLKHYASIDLKHLPHIRKMVVRNERIRCRRNDVGHGDKELLELRAKVSELRALISGREAALLAAFDEKNPKFDIITGKACT